jgi:HSP20 family molecular chaperone IbpA
MKTAPKSAGKLIVLENDAPISSEIEDVEGRIRARAYELSLLRGHGGRAVDDWVSAESEIISVPPAEMVERGDTFEVRFAVAGINPDDLNVLAAPQRMLLKCDYRHQHEAETGTVHLCDFKSATVFRSVEFPQPVNVKSMEVEFENGIVRVSAAKKGRAAAARAKPPAAPRKATATKKASKTSRGKM